MLSPEQFDEAKDVESIRIVVDEPKHETFITIFLIPMCKEWMMVESA